MIRPQEMACIRPSRHEFISKHKLPLHPLRGGRKLRSTSLESYAHSKASIPIISITNTITFWYKSRCPRLRRFLGVFTGIHAVLVMVDQVEPIHNNQPIAPSPFRTEKLTKESTPSSTDSTYCSSPQHPASIHSGPSRRTAVYRRQHGRRVRVCLWLLRVRSERDP